MIGQSNVSPFLQNDLTQVETPILPAGVVFIVCYQIADVKLVLFKREMLFVTYFHFELDLLRFISHGLQDNYSMLLYGQRDVCW